MEMRSTQFRDQNELGCYLRNLEHFSEFKMAASAMMNFVQLLAFDFEDLNGHVMALYWGFTG